jgi:hypothetical protein
MLLVIFGAGASYDSVHHLPPSPLNAQRPPYMPPRPDDEFRPPLAMHLFDTRGLFAKVISQFGDCRQLIPLLRGTAPVEQRLRELQDQANAYPERHRQLVAIRYYLHVALWSCEDAWHELHKGVTNHATFLDAIERWRFKNDQRVCIVTFNYDRIIENAMVQVLRCTFHDFSQYTSGENYKLIKLHGSVDWGRDVDLSPPRDITRVINAAADVAAAGGRLTGQFRKVQRPPMQFDDGSVGFPSLAIPVEKKNDFACPPDHVRVLEGLIPNVSKIITIGWRASEERFLQMLRSFLPGPLTGPKSDVDLMVVSGSNADAERTLQNLGIGGKNSERKRALRNDGFTGLINNIGHLEAFLD